MNDGEIVITYDDMTVAKLCELTKAQDNINSTFTDALVTYVQEKSAYIREGENAICAFNLGIALKEGQTINGSVKVNFELYRGMHEIIKREIILGLKKQETIIIMMKHHIRWQQRQLLQNRQSSR